MDSTRRIFNRRRLLLALALLLGGGFLAISLFGYQVARLAIRAAIIDQDLPLTSSNIYAEIQKDLIRPVLISSTMAHDTFMRDWVLQGENNVTDMARYLQEVKTRYGAFSSFFVSEKSGNYYTGDGILKRVSRDEPRDAWYYRVRDMQADYEINVDPDMANRDALTIFINYRVFDYNGNYIGATGIGLTIDAVRSLIEEYQQRYHRTIYFVDAQGQIVVYANHGAPSSDLRSRPGLGPLVDRILQQKTGLWQYRVKGDNHILNVNYLPELKWQLFVEQNEAFALAGARRALYANLAISAVITLLVMFLAHLVLNRYQRRLEDMAATDELTGLLNRHAFTILLDKMMAEYRRTPQPISILMADIDHFKEINDRHGHLAGDAVLAHIGAYFRKSLRDSDMAVRWGGEEFLLVLKNCSLDEARSIAEKLRQGIGDVEIGSNGQRIRITMSIGISQYDGSETQDEAMKRADDALYAAKQGGRNQVHVAT